MTIFHLIWWLIFLFIGFLFGIVWSFILGTIGIQLGFSFEFLGKPALIIGTLVSAFVVSEVFEWLFAVLLPDYPLPACRDPECRSNEPQWELTNDERIVQRCICGRYYDMNKHSYFEVLEDGKIIPYMKRKGFSSPWEPVDDSNTEHLKLD